MKPFTLLFSVTSSLGNYIKNRKITLTNHIPQKGDISVRKPILIVIGITAFITLIINIPNITAQAKWYSFERHKKLETVTKVVTLIDMADIVRPKGIGRGTAGLFHLLPHRGSSEKRTG